MPTIEASKLIEDFSIYPRNTVYDGNVSAIRDALEAGAKMPPLLVCKDTLRIVDGFHRRRAYIRLFGPDVMVKVTFRTYRNKADLIADAGRPNVGRGKDLCASDIHRFHGLLKAEGWDDARIGAIVGLTAERLSALCERKTATAHNGSEVALTRPLHHLAGTKMTKRQIAGAKKCRSGSPFLLHVNQLVHAIEGDLLPDDERIQARLHELAVLITKNVPEPVTA